MVTVCRKDLAQELHRRIGISSRICDAFVKDFFQEISIVLAKEECVNLRGMGTLDIYEGKSRVARDIHNGSSVVVPPMKRIRFVPSRMLRSFINN